MTSYRLAASAIAAVWLACGAPAASQITARAIPYEPDLPIVERLLPGDTTVLVEKTRLSSLVSGRTSESFPQEVERLSVFRTIVLLDVSATDGELTDNGTWVRSRFQGQAIQFLKRATQSDGNVVEFWHDGGATTIGAVNVTAGVYPRFVVGQRYLVFLAPDRARGTMSVGLAFRVVQSDYLEAMEWSDGNQLLPGSKLIGHTVPEVVAALK